MSATTLKNTLFYCLFMVFLQGACAGSPKKAEDQLGETRGETSASLGADRVQVTAATSTNKSDLAPWASAPVSDWVTPPPPATEASFVAPKAERFRLKNGLEVALVQRPALPLVALELIVLDAGFAADPPTQPGLADFTVDLLDESVGKGRRRQGALQIAEALEGEGAQLSSGVEADWASLSLSSLSRTLPASLKIFSQVLSAPNFDPADVKRVRDQRLDRLARRADRPRELAELVFAAALYGAGTPYGHPQDGSKQSLSHFDAKRARAFYSTHYLPEKMRLVIVGDLELAQAKALLEETLGGVHPKGQAKASPRLPAAIGQPPRLFLVDRPGAAQSDLRAGLVALSRGDARAPAFSVLATLLGGGFTSRLNQRLREELGYTYGARAGLRDRRGPGPFVISTALHTPHTVEGVAEILRMVGELSTTPVPEQELQKAKQYLIRGLPERFSTNLSTAATYAELWGHDLPFSWVEDYAAQVALVDAKSVLSLAQALIPERRLVFSLVGDASLLAPGLSKLLGRPTMRDSEGLPLPEK